MHNGKVHSADDWRSVLEPVVARYRHKNLRRFFRGDGAFAKPEAYGYVEAEGYSYAIRLPANDLLYRKNECLLTRAAGPELLAECKTLGGCPTGEARITQGYRLPAKYVIHTVGPVWRDGKQGEPDKLRNCYVNSLALAAENDIRSIAFPSISTGAYRYPVERAAETAVETVRECLAKATSVEVVRFNCFSARDLAVYQKILKSV